MLLQLSKQASGAKTEVGVIGAGSRLEENGVNSHIPTSAQLVIPADRFPLRSKRRLNSGVSRHARANPREAANDLLRGAVMPDAFAHLPHLRDKVTPPERSKLRATSELLASWDQQARERGAPPNWRIPDSQLEASRRVILGRADQTEDLWVFAYGALMWDPGFQFIEVRLAKLAGYQRRFSHKITMGRGSRDRPSLMLSLDECAGSCSGVVFRIASSVVDFESAIVWRREMLWDDYRPQLLPVSTPQGDVTALVFCANQTHPNYVGELPLVDTAAMIAAGSGMAGTNREYLELVATQLENLGIEDAYVRQLAVHVQSVA